MDRVLDLIYALFAIALFPLLYVGGVYIFLWVGLKILKLEVPRQKIIVYPFVVSVISLFVFPSMSNFWGENKFLHSVVLYLAIFIPSILIFKYYWRLGNIDFLKFLGWFLIGGAIVSFAVSSLFSSNLQQTQKDVIAPEQDIEENKSSMSGEEINISAWQSYNDTQLELKYPPDWTKSVQLLGSGSIASWNSPDNTYVLSLETRVNQFEGRKLVNSLDELYQSTVREKRDITLDGVAAIELLPKESGSGTADQKTQSEVSFLYQSNIYTISFESKTSDAARVRIDSDTFEQILSTLRFKDFVDTSDWQTYHSEEFEFEYPVEELEAVQASPWRTIVMRKNQPSFDTLPSFYFQVVNLATAGVDKNSSNLSLSEWIDIFANGVDSRGIPHEYGTPFKTSLGGKEVYRVDDVRGSSFSSNVYIMNNERTPFKLSFSGIGEDERKTLEQILFTFRFTN